MTREVILTKVVRIVSEQFGTDKRNITLASDVTKDFDNDSLDLVELLMAIEDEFEIMVPDEALRELNTIERIVIYIENNVEAR